MYFRFFLPAIKASIFHTHLFARTETLGPLEASIPTDCVSIHCCY